MTPLVHLLAAALSLQLPALRHVAGAPGPSRCHRPRGGYLRGLADSLRGLVMQLDPRESDACATRHFRGSLYGVTATVALHMRSRRADVELRGAPIGGALAGVGWLKDLESEAGEVELEEGFAARLAWRMVSIQTAALDRTADTVTVVVTVPFFGAQALTLERVSAPEAA